MVTKELEKDKSGKTLKRLSNWQDKVGTYTFIKKIRKDLKLKNAYKRSGRNDNDDIENLPEEVWVKICKEIVEEYKLTKKNFTPWNKQVDVITALLNSLQFGLDQGQIEDISDNENTIPLYCYGLGVFDFELRSEDINVLVRFANKKSEKAVSDYFAENNTVPQNVTE